MCSANGSVLIFDEVITGFRLGLGGAQARLGVTPDLTTMGKALANGMPLSAVAGKAELMEGFAPLGETFFSGTFYGHVLNVAVGLGCARLLEEEPPFSRLDALGEQLRSGIQSAIDETGVAAQIRQLGSVWALYFTRRPIPSAAIATWPISPGSRTIPRTPLTSAGCWGGASISTRISSSGATSTRPIPRTTSGERWTRRAASSSPIERRSAPGA